MAWKDHDLALAQEKQQLIAAPNRKIVVQGGVAAVKSACDWNGYYGGRARLPLIGPTEGQRKEIEETLATIRN